MLRGLLASQLGLPSVDLAHYPMDANALKALSAALARKYQVLPLLRTDTQLAIAVVGPLAWQTDALCAQTDPEAFFPEKGGSTRDAKRICTSCEVKGQCLDYALSNDERFGIWGGLSERERRRLRRARTA